VTDARPLPPAAWYPDPEYGGHLRWWDGYQWTVRMPSAGIAPARPPRPVGRGFQRLGGAVRLGLRLTGMLFTAQIALYAWGLSMFDDAVAGGDLNRLDDYDTADQALTIAVLVIFVPTAICWATWQYRLARSAGPGELTRGPGWHAFAYIVPIVCLWFPFQNMRDLWRRRFPERSRTVLGWWWAGWIAFESLARMYREVYAAIDQPGDFKPAVTLGIVTTVVGLAALVLAVRIQRALSDAELPGSRPSAADPVAV
jgi:hypothetical protein